MKILKKFLNFFLLSKVPDAADNSRVAVTNNVQEITGVKTFREVRAGGAQDLKDVLNLGELSAMSQTEPVKVCDTVTLSSEDVANRQITLRGEVVQQVGQFAIRLKVKGGGWYLPEHGIAVVVSLDPDLPDGISWAGNAELVAKLVVGDIVSVNYSTILGG